LCSIEELRPPSEHDGNISDDIPIRHPSGQARLIIDSVSDGKLEIILKMGALTSPFNTNIISSTSSRSLIITSSFLYLLGSRARMKAIINEQYSRSLQEKYLGLLFCRGDFSSLMKRK
jgi:hypothetical protein